MAVEGTLIEFGSNTYGHVWVSDEITFGAGPTNIDHDLGVTPDFVVAIVTDIAAGGVDLTCVPEVGNTANGITLTNAGTATATGFILAFFTQGVHDTSPTSGSIYELGSRSIGQVYISDEKVVNTGGGTQTFDHETGRNLLFAIPICVDSVDGDFDLSVAETTKSRLTVTNDGGAGNQGVVVLAFFGDYSTEPVGNTVEGTVLDIASLSLGYIFLSDETADIDNSSEALNHELVRIPKLAVPIIQETGGGGADDFDLSVTLATLIVTAVCADTDAAKVKVLAFFGDAID